MSAQTLVDTAHAVLAGDGGILAMDQSNGICDHRFAATGIHQGAASRRSYREMRVTTRLAQSIPGAILDDKTIRQRTSDGRSMVGVLTDAAIITEIKVDTGRVTMAGHPVERITECLDGLRRRLGEYAAIGARCAKRCAMFAVGEILPSRGCIEANVGAPARYAAPSQEAGLVAIIDPEVLIEGSHSMARWGDVDEKALRALLSRLCAQRVTLQAVFPKPDMVLPGSSAAEQPSRHEPADPTLTCLLRAVPAAVPAIAFLSGGQAGEIASARLNAAIRQARSRAPWALGFSFGRAIRQPALEIWQGDSANVAVAPHALRHRAICDQMARRVNTAATVERTVRP